MSSHSHASDAPVELTPKRLQITQAAERLFLANGYGAVSMDQVARTANVSKATLYAYFPSKDALFATIVSDKGTDNPLGEDLFPSHVTDLRASLEAIGYRMLRFMLRERTLAIYRIAMAESGRFPELGRAFYENGPVSMTMRFSAWLKLLDEAGLVTVSDPLMATNQFMALMRCGVFFRRSLAIGPAETEDEISYTVQSAADTWLRAYARLP
jgi:TetR/AcrR family transcriptional repressor of mexJK operon